MASKLKPAIRSDICRINHGQIPNFLLTHVILVEVTSGSSIRHIMGGRSKTWLRTITPRRCFRRYQGRNESGPAVHVLSATGRCSGCGSLESALPILIMEIKLMICTKVSYRNCLVELHV